MGKSGGELVFPKWAGQSEPGGKTMGKMQGFGRWMSLTEAAFRFHRWPDLAPTDLDALRWKRRTPRCTLRTRMHGPAVGLARTAMPMRALGLQIQNGSRARAVQRRRGLRGVRRRKRKRPGRGSALRNRRTSPNGRIAATNSTPPFSATPKSPQNNTSAGPKSHVRNRPKKTQSAEDRAGGVFPVARAGPLGDLRPRRNQAPAAACNSPQTRGRVHAAPGTGHGIRANARTTRARRRPPCWARTYTKNNTNWDGPRVACILCTGVLFSADPPRLEPRAFSPILRDRCHGSAAGLARVHRWVGCGATAVGLVLVRWRNSSRRHRRRQRSPHSIPPTTPHVLTPPTPPTPPTHSTPRSC